MSKLSKRINLQLFGEIDNSKNEDLFDIDDDYEFNEEEVDTTILEDKQYEPGIDEDLDDPTDPEEDLEDEDYEGAGEIEDEEADLEDEDIDSLGDEEDPEDENNLDKKTKALIRYKKDYKKTQQENEDLKRELEELRSRTKEQQLNKLKETKIDQLIAQGYSEAEATNRANLEVENMRLKEELAESKFRKLERQYPGISKYKDKILEYKTKFPELDMTEGEIFLAKFNKSQFDYKTQAEQETLYKQRLARSKSGVDGRSGKTRAKSKVKMSREEARAYELLKETDPSITPEEFISELYD